MAALAHHRLVQFLPELLQFESDARHLESENRVGRERLLPTFGVGKLLLGGSAGAAGLVGAGLLAGAVLLRLGFLGAGGALLVRSGLALVGRRGTLSKGQRQGHCGENDRE